jgi:hypothetical protein
MRTATRSPLSILATTLTLLSGTLALTCRVRQQSDHHPSPVLLVGVDGLEWDVLLPLLAQGQIPTFARLIENGSYGVLETLRPTFSPIIWTTIATGRLPAEHGIQGFVQRPGTDGSERRLYLSSDRRTKAFWNILSDYERRVAVVGWWMTYPAEEVNGVMVAQVNTLRSEGGRRRGIIKGDLVDGMEGQVFPRRLAEEYLAVHRRVGEHLSQYARTVFGGFRHRLGPTPELLWRHSQWAFLADASYLEIADSLAQGAYDLLAFYLGGADVVGHRFWRYMKPELYQHSPSPEELQDLGHIVPDYYRWVDGAIGRVLASMPASTTVIVVSDHGMRATNRNGRYDPGDPPRRLRSGGHTRGRAGVIILSGPNVRAAPLNAATTSRGDLPTLASVIDITPTLLALLEVPVGKDMPGRVLLEPLQPAPRLRTVDTHDTSEWREARRGVDPKADHEPERLEQLRALGYID